ncbi:MAG: hypothetical protein JST46_15075 [Bacteroidetes bacterium]|nr:hypothetical protein [Bacteroidota bacterium]
MRLIVRRLVGSKNQQGRQIKSIANITLVQLYRESDLISNKGLALITGSKNKRIGNNSEYVQMPDGNDDGLGNHRIETYTADEFKKVAPKIWKYLIDKKIIYDNGEIINENN